MKLSYCPSCTGQLTHVRGSHLLQCIQCDFKYFRNPAIGCNVILEDTGGNILMITRKHAPKKGFLDFPGGFVEVGETLEAAAVREIEEELHLPITNARYLCSYPDVYVFQGIKNHIMTVFFVAEATVSDAHAGDDAADIVYIHPRKVPWKRIGFESSILGLKDYIRFRRFKF